MMKAGEKNEVWINLFGIEEFTRLHEMRNRTVSSANVCDDRSPLAFGADPASAGCVTKVPKAW